MEKKDLVMEALNAVEELSSIMREYDSTQHIYGGYKLYQTEAHMIERIGNNPGISVTHLAVIFEKSVSACSQIIKKLIQKDFVTQYLMPENGRVRKLYLTNAGKKVYRDHRRLENRCYRRDLKEFSDISEADIDAFLKVSQRIRKCFLLDLEEQKNILASYDKSL